MAAAEHDKLCLELTKIWVNWNFSGRLEFVWHSNSEVVILRLGLEEHCTHVQGSMHMCVVYLFFNTAIWQMSCVTSVSIGACVLESSLEYVALVIWRI